MNFNFLFNESNILYLMGFIISITFVIISIIIWYIYGKDLNYKNVLKKNPPQTLNPLEFYLVYNGYLKSDSLMPMLLYLANKEYLTIIEDPKTKFTLKRNKKIDINNSLDKLVMQIIFKKNEITNLSEYLDKKNDRNTILDEVSMKEAIYNLSSNTDIIFNVINKQKNKYFEYKSDAKRSFLLALVAIILVYTTSIPFIHTNNYYYVPVSLIFSIATLYGIIKLINKYELQKISLINIISIIFGLCFIWILFLTPVFADNIIYSSLGLISIVSVIVILYIYKYMAKRTVYGTKLIKNIEGFKQYIISVKKEDISQEEEYINNLLSYTYILGINDILLSKIDKLNIKWLKTVDDWSITKIDSYFNRINKDIEKKFQKIQINKKKIYSKEYKNKI